MPFPFEYVCDLLQRLDDNRARKTPQPQRQLIRYWFVEHQIQQNRRTFDFAALLSASFPEQRTDRVYGFREKKLEDRVARAQRIGPSQRLVLKQWKTVGSGVDLGDCVKALLKATPNPRIPFEGGVTVEKIHATAEVIASRVRFSSLSVRGFSSSSTEPVTPLPTLQEALRPLEDMYRIVTVRDGKWLTRLFLKSYNPLMVDHAVVYGAFHPLLPFVMNVYDHFALAGATLERLNRENQGSESCVNVKVVIRNALKRHLMPVLGAKVGRQSWLQGRSIQYCLNMGHGMRSYEEKLDGEYFQIHIDSSKGRDSIQIFSKSGKDSTQDRKALHTAIRESLQIGEPSCPVTKGYILEGELVVCDKVEPLYHAVGL